MKLINFFLFILLVILFTFVLLSSYYVWLSFSSETSEFKEFHLENQANLSGQSTQFYPNMRYKDKTMGFHIEKICSQTKQEEARRAFSIIEEKTVLEFNETNYPEISVVCSEVAPNPKIENHFIAGEGGPVEIINATYYSVILLGKISLYRTDTCETPQIAIHEIFHALGFDHNNDTKSIMYPVTNCEQTIDSYVIDEINRIYSVPSLPDAAIESIEANKTGSYVNFEIMVVNYGLKEIKNLNINIFSENSLLKDFEIGTLEIGARKNLKITNLKIPRKLQETVFMLETSEEEITKENNVAKISIPES